MLKKVLLAVVVLVVGLGALVASRPSEFTVERSLVISAPSEVAFAQVNDFKAWAKWSPWAKLDPQMAITYEGPEAGGVGATYAWKGNKDVGSGKMAITESKPGELVKINLDFLEPFPASNVTQFLFAKEGEGTKVTWRMEGKNGFLGKAMCLVMDMDKMVGGDFEKGLADMKTASEAVHAQALAQAKVEAEKAAAEKAAAEQKAAEEAAQQTATAPAP